MFAGCGHVSGLLVMSDKTTWDGQGDFAVSLDEKTFPI